MDAQKQTNTETYTQAKVQPNIQALPSPVQSAKQQHPTPKTLFLLFCYLYFVQGAVMGIVGTMPYIYPALPDVHTMALFNSVSLPYSLKFLLAPLLQKHNSINYGKRKTWIMISQLLTGTTLLISAFYTQMQNAHLFAGMCLLMMTGMVLQNIALHSLIVKEITCATQSSLIQCFAEVFGILVGGLILLKLTSRDFAKLIGLEQPITNPKVILISFCCMILGPLLVIHLKFKEKTLQSERKGSRFTFCEIIQYYEVFMKPKTKYFRFCIFVLIYNQGLNFFSSLYDYQLVSAGFSRDTSNTIGNIVIIPIIFLTFSFSKWTKAVGGQCRAIFITTLALLFLDAYILFFFPINPWIIGVYTFFSGVLDAWRFFVFGVIINQFPLHALSGMYITMLGSFFNFGRLTSIHTELCNIFSWNALSWFGLLLQLIILIFLKRLFWWMEAGDVSVAEEIQQPSKVESERRQLQEVDIEYH